MSYLEPMMKLCPSCNNEETAGTVKCVECGFIWNPTDGRLKQNKFVSSIGAYEDDRGNWCAEIEVGESTIVCQSDSAEGAIKLRDSVLSKLNKGEKV